MIEFFVLFEIVRKFAKFYISPIINAVLSHKVKGQGHQAN